MPIPKSEKINPTFKAKNKRTNETSISNLNHIDLTRTLLKKTRKKTASFFLSYTGLPSIGYWAFTFAGGEPQYTTAFSPPSSVPLILSHCPEVMSFWERLWNHFVAFSSHVVMQVRCMKRENIV